MGLPMTAGQRTRAVLGLRCPECGVGRVFRSAWGMNERCPACGLKYEREESGYFTGAMYFSYALGIPIVALFTGLVWLVFPSWRLWQDVLLAWVLMLPLAPAIFRYSRVLWLHLDHFFDPSTPGPAGGPP